MLSDEDRQELRAQHGHRFPEVATLRLAAEDGLEAVQVVLANPSGAVGSGDTPAGVWVSLMRAALGFSDGDDDNLANAVAGDCLVWPSSGDWWRLVGKWPGLPRLVANEVRNKIGLRSEVSTASDGAVEVAVRGKRMAVKLKSPDVNAWRLTTTGMRRADADHWKIVRDMVAACVASVTVDREEAEWAAVAGRYPGLAVLMFGQVARRAGAVAEVELGEL